MKYICNWINEQFRIQKFKMSSYMDKKVKKMHWFWDRKWRQHIFFWVKSILYMVHEHVIICYVILKHWISYLLGYTILCNIYHFSQKFQELSFGQISFQNDVYFLELCILITGMIAIFNFLTFILIFAIFSE